MGYGTFLMSDRVLRSALAKGLDKPYGLLWAGLIFMPRLHALHFNNPIIDFQMRNLPSFSLSRLLFYVLIFTVSQLNNWIKLSSLRERRREGGGLYLVAWHLNRSCCSLSRTSGNLFMVRFIVSMISFLHTNL